MKILLRYCATVIFIILLVCGCLAGNTNSSGPGKNVAPVKATEVKARSVKITPEAVYIGQDVSVEAEIASAGDIYANASVTLTVNGEELQSKQLTLQPGSSGKISFTFKPVQPGKQTIAVAGASAALNVLDGKIYKSKLFGFSIYCPGGWSADEKTAVTLSSKDGPSIRMMASVLPPGADKAKFAAITSAEIQDMPGSTLISQVEVTSKDGEYAYRSEYTYLSGKLTMRVSALSIKKSGYRFTAAAECLEALWDDNKAMVEASISTFKIPGVVSGSYVDPQAGFSVTLPEGLEAINTGNIEQPAKILTSAGPLPCITIYTNSLPESTNPKSYLLSQLRTITNASLAGYNIASQAEISMGTARGHEAVAEVKSGTDTVVVHACCTLFQNRAYIVVASAKSTDYAKFKPVFLQMVSSFIPMDSSPFGVSVKDSLFLYYGEIVSLDPVISETSPADITGAIFSGLVSQDGNFKAVPDIAEKWEISTDGNKYTFHLREGVKFHDGKPVTAGDFKYSWERACDPKAKSLVTDIYLGDIIGVREMLDGKATALSGVKVIDDRTLEVSISGPKSYFLNKLCQPVAFVVDKSNVAQGSDWSEHPNGTGPFKLKEWAKDEKLLLERNESYYREPAKLKNIVFQIYAGNPQQMYEEGKIDLTGVSIYNLGAAQDPANPLNKQLVTTEGFSTGYLSFNVAKPPFDDPRVRRAFALALNVDKIVEVSLQDNSLRARGFIPKNIPGYNEANFSIPYSVAQAKKLIEESKYGSIDKLPPVKITVSGGLSPAQEAMLGMWKQNLGVDVSVEIVKESKEWQKRRYNRDMLLSTGSWRADYLDPQNFLEVLFGSTSKQNRSNYSNPEIDAALQKAAVETDADKRLKMYQEIEKRLLDDLPAVPLYMNTKDNMFVKPYVRDYKLYPVGINQWRNISVSR